MKKVLIGLLLVIIIGVGVFFGYRFYLENKHETYYLASDQKTATVLSSEEETVELVRGLKVEVYAKTLKIKDEDYHLAKIDDKDYYLKEGQYVKEYEDVVLEKTLYILKDTILYEDLKSPKIKDNLFKGETLEVLGYDSLKEDGSVNRYLVKNEKGEGNVRSEYVTIFEEEALKTYSDETTAIHQKRNENIYGGGVASELDFSPVEKVHFEDNPLLEEARTLYLGAGVLNNIDAYIELAKESGINAFVIDIRDTDVVSFVSDAATKYSPSANESAHYTKEEFASFVKKANDEGIYTIGRITVFRDPFMANDHPEVAITNTDDGSPFYHNGTYWPSAFSRLVWEYNVTLAKEAVTDCGFNEIQFDYMRFPDLIGTYEKNGLIDLKNELGETKIMALSRFLNYAKDEIHDVKAYLSVDVFGESANDYVTAYGQYWPIISNIVDVISAMPYPDHFNIHDYGITEAVWEVPYKLLSAWSSLAYERQKECPTPAVVRTWIQGYDSIKEPYVVYDAAKISEQIRALKDGGLDGGYIIWNSASSLEKYRSYASAFND